MTARFAIFGAAGAIGAAALYLWAVRGPAILLDYYAVYCA